MAKGLKRFFVLCGLIGLVGFTLDILYATFNGPSVQLRRNLIKRIEKGDFFLHETVVGRGKNNQHKVVFDNEKTCEVFTGGASQGHFSYTIVTWRNHHNTYYETLLAEAQIRGRPARKILTGEPGEEVFLSVIIMIDLQTGQARYFAIADIDQYNHVSDVEVAQSAD